MALASSPRQLALALDHAESFAREDFLESACNARALALIEAWPDWPDRVAALIGPRGAGKSHLASIWAERAGARFLSARALDLAALPGALATGALVLEDLAPDSFDDRALFHLFNLVREEQGALLLTARVPLASLPAQFADLASRLRAVPTASLEEPDDALLRAVLVKLFADRQVAVDESLIGYLVQRIERSLAAAHAVVESLDREALRLQRPVSRLLAAEVLREPGAGTGH